MSIILRLFFSLLFRILEFAILIDVVLSMIYPYGNNKYANMVKLITEPILSPLRKLQNKYINSLRIDLSPLFALLALDIIRNIIFSFLR